MLDCVKETLAFILTVHLGMESASDLNTEGDDDYDLLLLLREQVMNQLAEWYRQRFSLSAHDSDADCVSGFGSSRDWRWWDARVRTERDFLVMLDVSGWPCSGLTVLRRVLEKCGAESMDEIAKEQW